MSTQSNADDGTIDLEKYHRNYDMNSPELAQHWYSVVEDLHARCPLARSEVGEGYWIMNRHSDIREATLDSESFSSGTGFQPNRPEGMPYFVPVESDPPIHTGIRKAINPHFVPGSIEQYTEAVQGYADELVTGFADRDEIEAVWDFANPLPGLGFCIAVAGMEREDIDYLQRKFEIGIQGPIDERAPAMQAAMVHIGEYMERRRNQPPRGDVVDEILALEFDGFGWEQQVMTLTTLTLGGVGTTGYVIACALQYLGEHPEARRRLRSEPDLWPGAVEEFLRFYRSSPHDGRRLTTSRTVGGHAFQEGEYVVVHYGAANFDPDVFDDPYEFRLDREMPNRHLSFGFGRHRCVGSHLAKLEIRTGLRTFLEAFPDFTVKPGFEPKYQISNTRVMETLPLILRPAS